MSITNGNLYLASRWVKNGRQTRKATSFVRLRSGLRIPLLPRWKAGPQAARMAVSASIRGQIPWNSAQGAAVLAFPDRLEASVVRCQNPVLVGLDPRADMLPPGLLASCEASRPEKIAAAYEQFCREIIDVVARRVPAVKPQAAFFEELGPAGMGALAGVMRYAREQGLIVILDGKRLRPRFPGTRKPLGRRRADRQSLFGR